MVFDFQTFLAFTTDHTLYALCTDFAFEQEIVVESWGTNNGVVVWGHPGGVLGPMVRGGSGWSGGSPGGISLMSHGVHMLGAVPNPLEKLSPNELPML